MTDTNAAQPSTGLPRAVEFVLVLMLVVVTLPFLVITMLTSLATYRVNPFFVHERVGQAGRTFKFVKVRTLPPGTPRYTDKFNLALSAAPPVMRMIRATHLDELPQLWLVLFGRMSIVGPRPEMADLHRRISSKAATERLSIRPGVTGLWQVSIHSDGLICDRTEYDCLYVRHRSARLDLWILLATARKMIFGRRSHLHEVPAWAMVDGRGRMRRLALQRTVAVVQPAVTPTTSIAQPDAELLSTMR